MDSLLELFEPTLEFEGPYFKSSTAVEYVESLKSDPPRNSKYEVIGSYETETTACIIYDFSKPVVNTKMVQLFEVSEGKISKILLVFDTGAYT